MPVKRYYIIVRKKSSNFGLCLFFLARDGKDLGKPMRKINELPKFKRIFFQCTEYKWLGITANFTGKYCLFVWKRVLLVFAFWWEENCFTSFFVTWNYDFRKLLIAPLLHKGATFFYTCMGGQYWLQSMASSSYSTSFVTHLPFLVRVCTATKLLTSDEVNKNHLILRIVRLTFQLKWPVFLFSNMNNHSFLFIFYFSHLFLQHYSTYFFIKRISGSSCTLVSNQFKLLTVLNL